MHFVKESVYFIEENSADKFIELETDCWDSWLAEQPGLIHKQILIDSDNPNLVTVQVTWESAEKMSNLNLDDMIAIQEEFEQEVSDNNYAFELIKTDYFYTHNSIDNRLEIKLGGPGSGRRPSGVAPKAKPESTGKRGRPKKNNPEPASEQDSDKEEEKPTPKRGTGTGLPEPTSYTLDTWHGKVQIPKYTDTQGRPKKVTDAEVLQAVLTTLHPTRTPADDTAHRDKLLGVLNDFKSSPQARAAAAKAMSKQLAVEEEAKKRFPEVYTGKKVLKSKTVEVPEYDTNKLGDVHHDVAELARTLIFSSRKYPGGLGPSQDAVSHLLKDPTVPLKTKNKIAAIKSKENAIEAQAKETIPELYATADKRRKKREASSPAATAAAAETPKEPKKPRKPRKTKS